MPRVVRRQGMSARRPVGAVVMAVAGCEGPNAASRPLPVPAQAIARRARAEHARSTPAMQREVQVWRA